MTKPRALDLFCKGGGATKGLQRAGFDVTGIDIEPQPRYVGDRFIQADALQPPLDLRRFDFIWASPPCQAYSASSRNERARGKVYPDLIAATRDMLVTIYGGLFAIENVPFAPLRPDIVLDGTMFPELKVIRRRIFETNFFTLRPPSFIRPGLIAAGYSCVVGGGRCSGAPVAANAWHTAKAMRAAMGIDWMRRQELNQAVPPPYAQFIGEAVMQYIDR